MKFTALIPALNEGKTVGAVVKSCLESGLIDEVIVISDGSTDSTAEVARESGAHKVIELPQNKGKDYALNAGALASQSDYLVLLDADLMGLKPEHIRQLIQPILKGEAEATLGLFKKGSLPTDLAQAVTPFLSGQRVLPRWAWEEGVAPQVGVGFGLEVVLERFLKSKGIKVEKVYLPGLSHRMKEQKMGFGKGFLSRMKMYFQIFKALFGKGAKTEGRDKI
ncbi:MAG: glycosyltransferase family 2 protein [Caldiserica bacterium]|nr:glycosyltransferase family 2 protein [Caldisericota bacterium]MDH7562880.1 glycosyltransferase family 2 protein [Caldisericota bacterium]